MSITLTPHREDASRSGWQYRLHLDAPLLFTLIAVSALGLIVLYSAGGGDMALVERQLVRLGIAFTGMLIVAQLTPGMLKRLTPWLFVLGVLFLLAVLIGGEASGGAQRWLNLYIIRFQPSEMMKLAVPMMVAWYLTDVRLPPKRWQLLASATLIAVPMLMIAKQPDLGTALLIPHHPDEGLGKVTQVAVDPQRHGEGIGRRLMVTLESRAFGELGLTEVYCHAQNTAMGFYTRLGWETVGDEFVEAGIPHHRMRIASGGSIA